MDAPVRLTIKEVAERTRIPEATLRWFRHTNAGPRSYVLGRRVFYDVVDVDAWIAAQKSAGRGVAAGT